MGPADGGRLQRTSVDRRVPNALMLCAAPWVAPLAAQGGTLCWEGRCAEWDGTQGDAALIGVARNGALLEVHRYNM